MRRATRRRCRQAPPSTALTTTSSYVGRQPILDRAGHVVGYELLHRQPPGSAPRPWDADVATAEVVAALAADADALVGHRLAFVNVTRSFLLSGEYRRLSAGRTVLEITEDLAVDGRLLVAIAAARRAGYGIALDDLQPDGPQFDLVAFADVVKLDVLELGLPPLPAICRRLRGENPDIALLAEKVEAAPHVVACTASDFDLFQGFGVARPAVLRCRGAR